MLREIVGDRPGRRWFTDDALDLTVFCESDGRIAGFTLSHGKPRDEHALRWDARYGFAHQRVESGEDRPGRHKAAPLLDGHTALDAPMLAASFAARAGDLDQAIREFVLGKLARYPDAGPIHGVVRRASFSPPWWLRNRHVQTIVPNAVRRPPRDLALRRERVELPDGDFVDVDWLGPDGAPVVILLHGLEGNVESPYVQRMLRALLRAGWRGALLHFRGCSGEPNRLPRSYHSGDTEHLRHFLELLDAREPSVPRAAVGYSLGGNALLKWLGETGDSRLLRTAVAVSVPFDLAACADRIDRGFSRLYQWQLLRRMRRNVLKKAAIVPAFKPPPVATLTSFWAFDEGITAPVNGFESARDYYARCSSRRFLRGIRTPTLIVHSTDDPFMTPDVVPRAEELAPEVTLELADAGGHVGFVAASGLRTLTWLEARVPAHLASYLG